METIKEKWILVLPCHNQETIIRTNLELIKRQSRVPDNVVIVDDHSDNITLKDSTDGWVRVIHGGSRGRSTTRNRGIKEALDMGADLVFFMDGDSVPEDYKFFERFSKLVADVSTPKMIFGTRVHTERPYDFNKWLKGENPFFHKFQNMPSDLLTANMDNFQKHNPLDHTDLRSVAGVIESFNKLTNFHDKVDYMHTGMVSWSCNFAVTKTALLRINEFMKLVYNVDSWFDDEAFKSQWGYEDVAFGLDALYAGVSISMQDSSRVLHFMHGRSDDLYTHIQGKHLIMERYRHILKKIGFAAIPEDSMLVTGDVVVRDGSITRLGRKFEDSAVPGKKPITIYNGKIYKGWQVYDDELGSFKNSTKAALIAFIIKLLTKI